MRIVSLRKEARNGGARVAATVIWEDNDWPSEEIYFETRDAAAEDITPSPDAFLSACAMPALEYGERRVSIEGTVCPDLRNGLRTAYSVVRTWFPGLHAPTIEATGGFRPPMPRTPPRVALFWSGGIDSLASLRTNRLDYPLDHPASIRDGLYIFGVNGFDFVAGDPVAERLADFEQRFVRMEGLARESGVDLIPVYTNFRFIFRDYRPWGPRGLGAGLAAVAHTFFPRISSGLIASSTNMIQPLGTHPLLDPNYSTAALEIRHDGFRHSRIEKTAIVAGWETALNVMQCCVRRELPPTINCGSCKKCVRTMIHLAALGKLDRTRAFPSVEVTAEMIDGAELAHHFDAGFLEEAAPLFDSLGRNDLAEAIRRRLARYRAAEKPKGRRARVVGWGRHWIGSGLSRVVRAMRPGSSEA